MAHRSFGSTDPKTRERTTFDLQGTYEFDQPGVGAEGEAWKESFTCLSVVPSGALDDLISSVSTNPDGSWRFNSIRVVGFLTACLMPESRARFRVLMDDPSRPIDFAELVEVMEWLAGPVLGRPTTPPSS